MATIGAGIVLLSGAGSPEGAVTGVPGWLYMQAGGADAGTLWSKATGTGTTGWTRIAPTTGTSVPTGNIWYVATTGTAGNAGTQASPWSIAHAASGAGGNIKAGDTVYIRGGTYTSPQITVGGVAGKPITWRNFPGERAIFDGRFEVNARFNRVWGERLNFVCYQSIPGTAGQLDTFKLNGPAGHPDMEGVEVINIICHDARFNALIGPGGYGGLVYGAIGYNCGILSPTGHGLYAANAPGAPTALLREMCLFQNSGYQYHCYNDGSEGLSGAMDYLGCIAFGSGEIYGSEAGHDYIESRHPTQQAAFKQCYSYEKDGGLGAPPFNNLIGYPALTPQTVGSLSIEDCLFYGGTWINSVVTANLKVARNRFYGMKNFRWDIRGTPTPTPLWSDNIYGEMSPPGWGGEIFKRSGQASGTFTDFTTWQAAFAAATTPSVAPDDGMAASYFVSASGQPAAGNAVFVRPNVFEAGRGHLIIYNFADASTVAVDLSPILNVGDAYEIRNMQALWTTNNGHVPATPVLSGTYAGGTVNVPMTGVTPLDPIDRVSRGLVSPRFLGPRFGVFLVTKP